MAEVCLTILPLKKKTQKNSWQNLRRFACVVLRTSENNEKNLHTFLYILEKSCLDWRLSWLIRKKHKYFKERKRFLAFKFLPKYCFSHPMTGPLLAGCYFNFQVMSRYFTYLLFRDFLTSGFLNYLYRTFFSVFVGCVCFICC